MAMLNPNEQTARELLDLGALWFEKCELGRAREMYEAALHRARENQQVEETMESLAQLLRIAGEALDLKEIHRLERLLDEEISAHPRKVPATTWYCKGVIAAQNQEWKNCQRYFHRYIRAARRQFQEPREQAEKVARGWVAIANIFRTRNQLKRAEFLAHKLLREYQSLDLKGINGLLFFILGFIEEKRRNLDLSAAWYQKAQGAFLADKNWYYYFYLLFAQARISRLRQDPQQALWTIDLIERMSQSSGLGFLLREVQREKKLLTQEHIDMVIDVNKGVVKTRDSEGIPLGKQYILLELLEELSKAHEDFSREQTGGGLSKSEIIEKVWNERYRPEQHDNKLYYNINRLRKLIEPDMKNPKYLQNWKEGYRLAPGLRVQVVGVPKIRVQEKRGG